METMDGFVDILTLDFVPSSIESNKCEAVRSVQRGMLMSSRSKSLAPLKYFITLSPFIVIS